MSIAKRLKDYLDREKVLYEVLTHSQAHTASELAQALHMPGNELAKVVILRVGERFVMTVLPANLKIEVKHLRDLFQTHAVRLATEEEFKTLFPDCELGAMPPFGNLYGLDVYVDECLTTSDDIVFQAGTSSEAMKLRYQTFANLVRPLVAELHMPSSWSKTSF